MASSLLNLALYRRIRNDLRGLLPSGVCLPKDPYGAFMELPPDATVHQVRALALAQSIVKKFEDNPSDEADDVAYLKFITSNAQCQEWKAPSYGLSPSSHLDAYDAELLHSFKKNVSDVFYKDISSFMPRQAAMTFEMGSFGYTPLSWSLIAYLADVGPGSVLGGDGGSWFEKFNCSTLTYSREFLWDLYNKTAHCRPSEFSEHEKLREAEFGHVLENACKLLAVPKKVSESRGINIGPALDMYYQQGVKNILEACLNVAYGIDLSSQQERNRKLAEVGSISGGFATLDLSSASDLISYAMVKWCLPKEVFQILDALRTPFVSLPWGSTIPLHMMCTMGNAYCFPLQCIIFAAVVQTVYEARGIPFRRLSKDKADMFAVNGDDIIVVRDAYNDVRRLLALLGFVVNESKSFNEGFFRESCGGDFWKGHPVRGVYCRTLKRKQDFISLINRLNRWSAISGIPLPRTIHWLIRKAGRCLVVPPSESDDSGIHLPLVLAAPTLLLQSKDAPKRFKLKGSRIVAIQPPYYGEGAHHYYQKYFFRKEGVTIEALEESSSRSIAAGLLLAVVKGEMAAGRLVSRRENGRYTVLQSSTHSWDADAVGLQFDELYMYSWTEACGVTLDALIKHSKFTKSKYKRG